MCIELYAKIEHLLDIQEATNELHSYFLELLAHHRPVTLLDVGCGKGSFLKACKAQGIHAVGIDTSHTMIEWALKDKLSVSCQDISQTVGSYDAITAIFDVLNFVPPDALQEFFDEVSRLLAPNGLFLVDINTLYGFEEVAHGVFVHDEINQSLIVEANFADDILTTKLSHFTLSKEGCYIKESETITQYFHAIATLLHATSLTLEMEMPIELYAHTADKAILVFRKNV